MHACPHPESTLNPTPTPEMYKTTDLISTFDYIQTEYINMQLKQKWIKKKKNKKKERKKENKQKKTERKKKEKIQRINKIILGQI